MDLAAELASIVGERGIRRDGIEQRVTDVRGYVQGHAELAVFPRNTEEVAAVVRRLAELDLAFVPQGGNTGLCGGAIPNDRAPVLVCLDRMDDIEPIDADNFTVTVGGGAILSQVRDAAADAGCLFPLSIGAEGSCQIGGNIATNAGGHNVLRYGSTRELVLGLEVVLPDGRVWSDLRGLRKDNTGYALKHLFIGAEGTTGLITRATLALVPQETRRETALVAVPSVDEATGLLRQMQRQSAGLITAFEYMGATSLATALTHVPGETWPMGTPPDHALLIEVSRPPVLPDGFSVLEAMLEPAFEDGRVLDAVLAANDSQRAALWRMREAVVEGLRIEGGLVAHDITIPISTLGRFLTDCNERLLDAFPGCRPAPFGHLGDGNLHYNVQFPAGAEPAEFLAQRTAVNRVVYDVVHSFGGSFSAEHGVGSLKLADMRRYKPGVDLDLMATIKSALDPENRSNPGKVIPE